MLSKNSLRNGQDNADDEANAPETEPLGVKSGTNKFLRDNTSNEPLSDSGCSWDSTRGLTLCLWSPFPGCGFLTLLSEILLCEKIFSSIGPVFSSSLPSSKKPGRMSHSSSGTSGIGGNAESTLPSGITSISSACPGPSRTISTLSACLASRNACWPVSLIILYGITGSPFNWLSKSFRRRSNAYVVRSYKYWNVTT